MSATEVLRRLLDERGVEWESGLPTETIVRKPNDALYVERPDGRMHVYFRSYLTPEQAIAATLGPCSDSSNCTDGERTDLAAENAALREQMERLVTLLRNDCDIEASWDGLRRFWSIGLTEGGCLMRDRACKAEAENARLREQVADTCMQLGGAWVRCTELRELVRILAYCMSEDRDCDRCVLNGADMPTPRISACDSLPDRLREAGIEAD